MPPTFAAAPKCLTCGQSVYHAEKAPGSKPYHKACFKCVACGKRLDASILLEHDDQPYCKPCHSKAFGAKGYGAGGALVGTYAPRSPPATTSPPRVPSQPPTQSFLPSPTPKSTISIPTGPPAPAIPPKPAFVSRAVSGTAPTAPATPGTPPTPVPPANTPATAPTLPSRASFGGSPIRSPLNKDLCRRCGEQAYAAESVMALGHKWHKRCLRCVSCSSSLSAVNMLEHDSLPYCRKCHLEQWGTMTPTRTVLL